MEAALVVLPSGTLRADGKRLCPAFIAALAAADVQWAMGVDERFELERLESPLSSCARAKPHQNAAKIGARKS